MQDIKCIVFDWGGVLIDNPVENFAKECSNKIGVDLEQLKSAYSDYAFLFERGLIEESELWKNIGSKLNVLINSEDSIWYECFKKIYSPRQSVFNLAKKLKRNGYIVSLLSNTEIPAMNFFLDQNYEMFDYKVFSCKEGTAKPDPEIYNILLKKVRISPIQILFIDDKIENIETAKILRMNTIQFSDENALFQNIENHGIIL